MKDDDDYGRHAFDLLAGRATVDPKKAHDLKVATSLALTAVAALQLNGLMAVRTNGRLLLNGVRLASELARPVAPLIQSFANTVLGVCGVLAWQTDRAAALASLLGHMREDLAKAQDAKGEPSAIEADAAICRVLQAFGVPIVAPPTPTPSAPYQVVAMGAYRVCRPYYVSSEAANEAERMSYTAIGLQGVGPMENRLALQVGQHVYVQTMLPEGEFRFVVAAMNGFSLVVRPATTYELSKAKVQSWIDAARRAETYATTLKKGEDLGITVNLRPIPSEDAP